MLRKERRERNAVWHENFPLLTAQLLSQCTCMIPHPGSTPFPYHRHKGATQSAETAAAWGPSGHAHFNSSACSGVMTVSCASRLCRNQPLHKNNCIFMPTGPACWSLQIFVSGDCCAKDVCLHSLLVNQYPIITPRRPNNTPNRPGDRGSVTAIIQRICCLGKSIQGVRQQQLHFFFIQIFIKE